MSSRRTVAAVTGGALVLRVATLGVQSYWADEAATVQLLHRSFGGMLRGVVDGESTPPLYYVLAWLWAQVAGTGEVGLRLFSALVATAAVPVVAALAARVAGERAAVAAALLAAVSPLMVWYGQEARAYALLMLLVAASTLALLRALDAPTRGRLAAWAALAVAAMWSHHFALFAVVAQAGWALWVLRARAVPAVAAVAAGALALAPLLLHQREAGRAGFIARESLLTRLAQLPKQVLVGYDGPLQTTLGIVSALAVLVLLAGAARALRRGPAAGTVVVSVIAVAIALPVLAALVGQDFVLTRNLLGVLPLALAVLGAGAALAPRPAGAVALAVLLTVGLTCTLAVDIHRPYQRDDFRSAVRAAVDGPLHPRLVVGDPEGRRPLTLYLGAGTRQALRGVPVTVSEIDVVKVAASQPGGDRSTPRLDDIPTPAGFLPAGTATGATWAVRRFVAPRPVAVDPATLPPLEAGHVPLVLARGR